MKKKQNMHFYFFNILNSIIHQIIYSYNLVKNNIIKFFIVSFESLF